VTPRALSEAIHRGTAPAILDVRTPAEYAAGHVRGATNIPFNEVGRRATELASLRERPLIVYCGHGPRAWMAGVVLRRHGFRHIRFLGGHMAGWRRAGLPEERGQS
jgi:rhodanese-related sulfurtransferase